MAKLLTHQIRVETEEENVTVTIGNDGGIPGGFAKLFNRVIDSEAWARLSDAGRAAYLPLVRFADHKNQFRVQIGQATLMKYSGLSRSSVKRAIKDLLSSKLVVLMEQGGVTAEGLNSSNLYQLMVPTEGRKRSPSPSDANPQGDRQRTPSRVSGEPPAGPEADPVAAPSRTLPRAGAGAERGSAGGPQLRSINKELSNKKVGNGHGRLSDPVIDKVQAAAVLLEEKGVEPAAARQLAETYPYERVVDVVATMEYRRAHGKCDNPGGFLRDALVKQWATPKAVIEARRRAEAKLKQQVADDAARRARAEQDAQAGEDDRRAQHLIDSLDDDELAILAESVLAKYEGNSAVLMVLTRKPPRECRLMKMEIAAMMGGARAG